MLARRRILACAIAALACACALAACASAPKPHSRAPGLPPEITFYAQNLLLPAGVARAPRIGFGAFDPSVRVIVDAKPDTATIVGCPLATIGARIPDVRACHTLASGVREELTSDTMGAIAIVLLSPARATANVVMSYDQKDRHLRVSLPVLQAVPSEQACADNACDPFFELQPVRDGTLRAGATWSGGPSTLEVLQGSVLGHSQTATGIPYRQAGVADGTAPLQVSAEMTAPGEYALVLRPHAGVGTLSGVTIDATWP